MPSNSGYAYLTNKPSSELRGNRHDTFSDQAAVNSAIAYVFISLIFIYFFLDYLNLLPFTFTQAIWRIIVSMTPSRLLLALDKEGTELLTESKGFPPTRFANFQDKSEAMQRVLGIDGTVLLPAFPRSGILGNALLGSRESHPPGLGNWDNSCYQNSIIQGMASLRSLESFLGSNIRTLGHRHLLSTHSALKEIIDKLNDTSYSGRHLWIPPALKSMSSWQQQDAQEYFSKIVEQMDKEVRYASKGLTANIGYKVSRIFPRQSENTSSSQSSHSEDGSDPSEEQISASNPLEGLLAQRVGCMRCGYTEGLSLIPFNCLTVSLGRRWQYDVRELLDEYTALESIEGVECAKCTLTWTQTQLQQLLKQIRPESESEATDNSAKLTEALKRSAEGRLENVQASLADEDFSEAVLSEKCHISPRNRVSSTKSKQVVIARGPKSLIIHVNRSVFDELTGALRKNLADVKFPDVLNLGEWCLGTRSTGNSKNLKESWTVDPSETMLTNVENTTDDGGERYGLRALITHYGRHDNGHYICYRKYPVQSFSPKIPQSVIDADGGKAKSEHWFRLSDDDVSLVSESHVMSQGGVFMLFYERLETSSSNAEDIDSGLQAKDAPLGEVSPDADQQITILGRANLDVDTASTSSRSRVSGSISSSASDSSNTSDDSSTASTCNTHPVAPVMKTNSPHIPINESPLEPSHIIAAR